MNFLPARVVERDEKGVDGRTRRPDARPVSRSRSPGRRRSRVAASCVGVRPEHFGDAGKGDADLLVKVDIVEHLGGTSFVYASTPGDHELVIQRDAEWVVDASGPDRLDPQVIPVRRERAAAALIGIFT